MYRNLQCTIGNRNYPDEPVETQGARFLQYQLIASDLDGPVEPTVEYQDSLARSKITQDGIRIDGNATDATSFMFNVQLERSNAGYCIDGIDTNGQNIPIQLKGGPIAGGVNDTYYCYAIRPGVTIPDGQKPTINDYLHPPAPEVWICQETFWRLSVDRGVEYLKTEQPPNIQQLF
jgi:hypothetical protein